MVNLLLEIVKSNRQTWEHRRELCFRGLVVFKDETNAQLSPFIFGKKLTAHGSWMTGTGTGFPLAKVGGVHLYTGSGRRSALPST